MSNLNSQARPAVMGPDGNRQTIDDLPSADTKRWVSRRKAEVVAAVGGGLLSLDAACARWSLSVEEFMSWRRDVERHGVADLRATRVQQYRDRPTAAE